MKKIISQISLILLIMVIGIASVLIPEAYAADATITVSSKNVQEGDSFTVTVNMPSDAVGYQGKIKVFYKDSGTTDSSKEETKLTGIDGDFKHPGNMTATFTAKKTGEVQISFEGIISDINSNALKNPASTSIMVASKPSTPSNGDSNAGSNGNNSSGNSNTGSSTNSGSTSDGNSGSSNAGDSNSGTTTNTPKFTDVNETVYTTTRCNLRENYSTSSNKVATVNEGTKLTRKGVGDNGWSKCDYNGKTVYVSSQYLTTTAPETDKDEKDEKEPEEVKFKDTKENLYAKQSCNLRASWSTDSEKVGYLNKGDAVERTGYADNGWSRILYNGKTVYVASRLLSVEKPEEDEEKEENTVKNEVVNETVVDSTIINEEVEKLTEEEMLNLIKEEVGVLPEVGTNVANIAYVVVTLMAICSLACGIIYIKKIK